MYIYKRPYLDEFLMKVAKFGTVCIFTASVQKYADPIIDIIDPKGIIKKRYYREVRIYGVLKLMIALCSRQIWKHY